MHYHIRSEIFPVLTIYLICYVCFPFLLIKQSYNPHAINTPQVKLHRVGLLRKYMYKEGKYTDGQTNQQSVDEVHGRKIQDQQ